MRHKILPLTDIQLDMLNIFLRHQACIDLLDISTILPICHKVKSFLIFPIMIRSSKRPRLEIMKFESFYENCVLQRARFGQIIPVILNTKTYFHSYNSL